MSMFTPRDISAQAAAADIARELREHPEQWRKGVEVAVQVEVVDDGPCCLVMHLNRRGVRTFSPAYATFVRLSGGVVDQGEISKWNDARERSVDDVITLCEKVARS